MARVNVYLPTDLAHDARAAGLNVSALARAALREVLADVHEAREELERGRE